MPELLALICDIVAQSYSPKWCVHCRGDRPVALRVARKYQIQLIFLG